MTSSFAFFWDRFLLSPTIPITFRNSKKSLAAMAHQCIQLGWHTPWYCLEPGKPGSGIASCCDGTYRSTSLQIHGLDFEAAS